MRPALRQVPSARHRPTAATARGNALVLAPVLPAWDEGAFFAPVVRTLTDAQWSVTVVDTLALWEPGMTELAHLTDAWADQVSADPPDLLCGNALGGAVAQGLLDRLPPHTPVLLVSGPARSDAVLDRRLAEIADLAAAGQLSAALDLLARRVRPHDDAGVPEPAVPECAVPVAPAPPLAADDAPHAARRLAAGLRLLRGVDVSATVQDHPGRLLNLVGSRSQLVTAAHTAAAPHHTIRPVTGCGMRPHVERPALVSRAVRTFLDTQENT